MWHGAVHRARLFCQRSCSRFPLQHHARHYETASHGIIDGMWGIMRAYKGNRADLVTTAGNPAIKPLPPPANAAKGYSCPPGAPERTYYVNATSPTQIVINSRGSGMT